MRNIHSDAFYCALALSEKNICFLLRLGFIGKEYKEERKILLRNLTGSSAFKGGAKNEDNQ